MNALFRCGITLVILIHLYPPRLSAQSPGPVSGQWLDVFGGASSTNERITALERMPDGRLLIGGYFSEAMGIPSEGIAIWDGESVTPFPGDISSVLDVATYGDSILVGGYFNKIDNVWTNGLAIWNGSSWDLLGTRLRVYETATPFVEDFTIQGDTVYISGNLSEADGIVSEGIIGWDGSQFFSLGGGVTGPSTFDTQSSEVNSVDVDSNGDVYVGGRFTGAGSVETGAVARWDGNEWHSLGSGVHGYVTSVVVAGPDSVYVGGSFTLVEDGPTYFAAVWDGTEFMPLEGGPDSWVLDIVRRLDGSIVFAGNSVWSWDGADWTYIGDGIDGGVMALEVDTDGSLLAGGLFTTTTVPCGSNLARYNEGEWEPIIPDTNEGPTPWLQPFGMITTTAVHPTSGDLIAGGPFKCIGDQRAPFLAQWDGARWSSIGGTLDDRVSSVAFDRDGRLIVGGSFENAGTTPAAHIAQLVDGEWSAMGSGFNDWVSTMETCPDGYVYASGRFDSTGLSPARHVARWNGEDWLPLGEGLDQYVLDFECDTDGSGVFAGGYFSASGEIELNRIAHWTGTEWQAVGGGVSHDKTDNWYVAALHWDSDGSLLVGGQFTDAGDVPAQNIARWTGSEWEEIGDGLNSRVSDLAFDSNGILLAVGSFSSDLPSFKHIAAFVDGAWTGLEGEPDQPPHRILATQFGMVITGYFFSAGSVRSNNIGIWKPAPVGSSVSEPANRSISELEVYPSPARDRVTVKLSTPSVNGREISIVDTLGKIVARFETGPNSGEPLDIDVRNYPAGLYLVVVRATDGSLSQRKTVVVL